MPLNPTRFTPRARGVGVVVDRGIRVDQEAVPGLQGILLAADDTGAPAGEECGAGNGPGRLAPSRSRGCTADSRCSEHRGRPCGAPTSGSVYRCCSVRSWSPPFIAPLPRGKGRPPRRMCFFVPGPILGISPGKDIAMKRLLSPFYHWPAAVRLRRGAPPGGTRPAPPARRSSPRPMPVRPAGGFPGEEQTSCIRFSAVRPQRPLLCRQHRRALPFPPGEDAYAPYSGTGPGPWSPTRTSSPPGLAGFQAPAAPGPAATDAIWRTGSRMAGRPCQVFEARHAGDPFPPETCWVDQETGLALFRRGPDLTSGAFTYLHLRAFSTRRPFPPPLEL